MKFADVSYCLAVTKAIVDKNSGEMSLINIFPKAISAGFPAQFSFDIVTELILKSEQKEDVEKQYVMYIKSSPEKVIAEKEGGVKGSLTLRKGQDRAQLVLNVLSLIAEKPCDVLFSLKVGGEDVIKDKKLFKWQKI